MKKKGHKVSIESDSDSSSIEVKSEPKEKIKQEVKEEPNNDDKKISLKRKAEEPLSAPGQKVLLLSSNNEMWWNDNEEENEEDETKFEYLEHQGPFFPPFFEATKAKIKYKGEYVELDPIQEELAWYWCQTIGTDWEKKDTYKNNFASQFLKKFKGNDKIKSLDDFDFSSLVKKRDDLKEFRSNRTTEEKKLEKDQKLERDMKFGFCIVDGVREKVGNYSIEPPTLFKGRGDHPKAGFLKGRIKPEDITINCSEKAPVPKCTIPGHSWKEVVHNNKVTWLASYTDNSVKAFHKYIFLAASSRFKGINDRKKYEKARRLKSLINKIREDYEQKLRDKDAEKRQLGTATYLIDKFALRVGNEKSEDEADTVGCCSLRVEHVTIEENNKITLDFLGKDSMRYHNTVQVTEIVWKNIQSFHKGKKSEDNLFDRINATTLNEYLRGLMPGLTAKVFRTYNASSTLQQELARQNTENHSLEEKVQYYNEANKQVAILCNHQKTVSKNFDLQKEKMMEKINIYETYLKELKGHLEKVKKRPQDRDEIRIVEYGKFEDKAAKKTKKEEKKKEFKKKFPATKEKTDEAIKMCEKNLRKEKVLLADKEQNKEIALGTSKINYNDPRISVSWCKRNECPIEKVFAKALREKFPWAMSVDPEYEF